MDKTAHNAALGRLLDNLSGHLEGPFLADIACGTATALDYMLNHAGWSTARYPRLMVANDFSDAMLQYARRKMRMRFTERMLARLAETFGLSGSMLWGEHLQQLALRERMTDAGLMPKVILSRQDAASLVLPCAPTTILCSYGFHWFLDKKTVVSRVAQLLAPGGVFISVEEWPVRITPSDKISNLEKMISANITPIPLAELYALFERAGLRLMRLFESGIPPAAACVAELAPTQVDEITHHKQREHAMFGAIFVKGK